MPDSISSAPLDTIAPAPAPWQPSVCRPHEAPQMIESVQHFTIGKIPWSQGITPQPRAMLPGYDSGVMCLLITALLMLAVNFRHCSTYLKNLPDYLWSVKTATTPSPPPTPSAKRASSLPLRSSSASWRASSSILFSPPLFLPDGLPEPV